MNTETKLFTKKDALNPEVKPFEFQNWTVYQKSIALICMSDIVCRVAIKNGHRSLGDQIRRASQSIILNIAEGSSRFTVNDKLSFLRIAKGSLFECVAAIDIAKELKLTEENACIDYQNRAAEIGRMLSGMIRAISSKGGQTKV